jgi:purine-binding chemotaxis protein CheW
MNVHFRIGDRDFALPLSAVERVIQAVGVDPLPEAPDEVVGVIDVQGSVIPVVDLRRRFGMDTREIDLSDQFIIAKTPSRSAAVLVDQVCGVISYSIGEMVPPEEIIEGIEHIRGIVRREGRTVFVLKDLDVILSASEPGAIESAAPEN